MLWKEARNLGGALEEFPWNPDGSGEHSLRIVGLVDQIILKFINISSISFRFLVEMVWWIMSPSRVTSIFKIIPFFINVCNRHSLIYNYQSVNITYNIYLIQPLIIGNNTALELET